MNDDYDGADAYDLNGDKVGTIERTYVDDADTVRYVSVRTGMLLHHHRLVPADRAEMRDDGVYLPYLKDVIDDGPDVDPADELEGQVLDDAHAYYDRPAGETLDDSEDGVADGTTAARPMATADDDEDHVDDGSGEIETVAAGSTDQMRKVGQVRDLGDVIEVPIVEEVLVKRPVVREVVRIRKNALADRTTVGSDLRKETVEVDSDEGVPVTGDLTNDQ